jgi:hypothetical protein
MLGLSLRNLLLEEGFQTSVASDRKGERGSPGEMTEMPEEKIDSKPRLLGEKGQETLVCGRIHGKTPQ